MRTKILITTAVVTAATALSVGQASALVPGCHPNCPPKQQTQPKPQQPKQSPSTPTQVFHKALTHCKTQYKHSHKSNRKQTYKTCRQHATNVFNRNSKPKAPAPGSAPAPTGTGQSTDADLVVTPGIPSSHAISSDMTTWDIVNNGPAVATAPNFSLLSEDSKVSFSDFSTDSGQCFHDSWAALRCPLPALAPGQHAHIAVRLTSKCTGDFTLRANAFSSERDPDWSNNLHQIALSPTGCG
jgi:hypothetical protein